VGTTYSLRFRLRAQPNGAVDQSDTLDSLYAWLDRHGVAEDVADVGVDGTYVLWLTVEADDPHEAVGRSMALVENAQREVSPLGTLDEIVSIEIAATGRSDDAAAIPAAI
jgi:hypothetical protein